MALMTPDYSLEQFAGELLNPVQRTQKYVVVRSQFDTAVEILQRRNYELATVAAVTEGIRTGELEPLLAPPFSHQSVLCNHAFVQTRKEEVLLVSGQYNPLIPRARQATRAHQQQKPFYFSPRLVSELEQQASADPLVALQTGVFRINEQTDLLSKERRTAEIPVKAFAQEPLLVYLFGGSKAAEKYGLYLQEQKIQSLRVDYNRLTAHWLRQLPHHRLFGTGLEMVGRSRIQEAPLYDQLYQETSCVGVRKGDGMTRRNS